MWFSDTLKEKVLEPTESETYIEVDSSEVWTFILLVEDYDGNVKNYYTGGTYDGVISLDFTAVSSESVPNTAGLAYSSSGDDYIIWQVTTPSNVEKDWKLKLEYKESEQDWTEAEQITIKGDEGYQYVASTNYYVKTFIKASHKARTFNGRVKFQNNENEESASYGTANASVSASFSISAPNPPTSLSLSTSQSDYQSVITASWTASTSADVVSYEVEYKQQGKTWADSSSTTVRDDTEIELEVEENLHYDVRVRSVSDYDLNSSWVSDSVKSYNVSGDSSEPNSYVFDDSECEAVVLNGKRYAHLVWKAESTASPDIKNFHIRYANEDDDLENFYVTAVDVNVYIPNTGYSVETVSGDVFETYIEISTTDNWHFMLYAEDYDGYVYNSFVYSFTSGDQTDDAYLSLDFSGTTIGATPGTPTINTVSTGYTRMVRVTFTPPSNVDKRWTLETQAMITEGEWGSSQYFKGTESYQWKAGETYYIRHYVNNITSTKNVGFRIRFVNNGVVGSWAYGAGSCYAYASAPSQPASVSVSSSTAGGVEIITLTCPEVTNATGYDWLIANNSSGTGVEKEDSSSTNEISFFGPHAYDWNYALVRAKNEGGESAWRYGATGW